MVNAEFPFYTNISSIIHLRCLNTFSIRIDFIQLKYSKFDK